MRLPSIYFLLSIYFIFPLYLAVTAVGNISRSIKMGIVLGIRSNTNFDYYNIQPAIDLAINRSLEQYGIDFQPFPSIYEGYCNELTSLKQVVRALDNSVDFIVGPGCSDDLALAAKLTTVYKTPIVTGGGTSLDSTSDWPYLTRMAFSTKRQWSLFGLMSAKFNWTNVFVAYESDMLNGQYARSLIRFLRDNGISPFEYSFKTSETYGVKHIDAVLQTASENARVIFMLMSPAKVRLTLLRAQERKMCSGDYAFLALDPLKTDIIQTDSWRINVEIPLTCRAFFVLSIRFRQFGPEYEKFKRGVLAHAQELPGGQPVTVNSTFHDAVVFYAMVLNETLRDGYDISRENVDYVASKLINRTFNGCVNTVYIDGTGDRAEDYQMFQMAPPIVPQWTGPFSLIAEYYGFRNAYEPYQAIRWPSPGNRPPVNRPPCDYDGLDQACVQAAKVTLGASLGGVIALLMVSSMIGFAIYRYVRLRRELNNFDWLASWHDITIHQRVRSALSMTSGMSNTEGVLSVSIPEKRKPVHLSSVAQIKSRVSLKSTGTHNSLLKTNTIVATHRGTLVMLRPCVGAHVPLSPAVRTEVRIVKGMACENLLKMVAACIEPGHVTVLNEFCSRGTLQDVLNNDAVSLDWVFRYSFINDIVNALSYIQLSSLQTHGRLSSRCCYIDKRFILKTGDYGLPSFYATFTASVDPAEFLWTAPEILRCKMNGSGPSQSSEAGDVYAFAIILQEIILRESPYFLNNLGAEEILEKVQRPSGRTPYRPIVHDTLCHEELIMLMTSCWSENPDERTTFPQVKGILRNLTKSSGRQRENIIDALIERMEKYAASLEVSVDEKTQLLIEEKKKTEQLLYSILPKAVAEQLRRGEPVPPESYDSVTIYFGDIVEFTKLSAASSAFEIVTLMNDLYGQFDVIIMGFDAYKVETIGDCYVIVSGLPHRNGQKHAGIIGRLALTLRESIKSFKVQHMPGRHLQLRIGLNSGPCVAGVVGFATPRYCLFGDTVNVAARMESTGEAMKIQITQATESILRVLGSFDVQTRGIIPVKGKGELTTFWLNGAI